MSPAELVDPPGAGRVFERAWRPGIADAVGNGRVRLDAIARWLADVAYLDLLDAGLEERGVWIARRARLRVHTFTRFGDEVTLRTFCSGIGRFSAERRTTVSGGSAAIEEELSEAAPERFDAEIEYRDAALPGEHFVFSDGASRWLATDDDRVLASIALG